MIQAPSRRSSRRVQSQIAAEVLLAIFAVIFAALLVRLALHVIGVDADVWARSIVDRLTTPFVWPLTHLPGGRRPLIADATLPDLTTVAICVLFLLALGSSRGRP
jgi:hypothetical protein